MNTLTLLFLCLLALALVTELWLARRHVRCVQAHRASVPRPFKGKIPLRAHRKAADYTIAKTRYGQIETSYSSALLLAWTLGGGLEWIDRFWRGLDWSPLVSGTAFMLSVLLLANLLVLPFNVYFTFGIEQRFGFNRTSPALFVSDLIKKTLLLLAVAGPLIFAALWLMQRMGNLWWLYLWLLWVAFTLFMVWAYPTLIAPLFNRFRPLKDSTIRRRIQNLLRRTGFRSQGIFVVDSSRRTTHGNAYFTGFGRAKRIVFFDSLLKTLRTGEVEAVVAHELGHFKLHHITKRLLIMSIMSFAGLALLGWLIQQPWFYSGLGVSHPSNHMALVLFVLVGPVFTFFLGPLFAWSSRLHEYEADDFAAEHTDARRLVSALVKLYRENAATLTPDPLHSAFYDSHPPALARIASLTTKY